MYIADLHIHSHYSRATSRELSPEYLDLWARKKGIQIIGTGDFTHPAWREELRKKLAPAEDGLYVLKREYVMGEAQQYPSMRPRFVITGELSSIYKKNDKTRKVHSVLMMPGLEDAEVLSRKLETIGNIHSDGRPILGLDCHDLLAVMLELAPRGIYVPAHIWTPHFSLFGAFSGFDTIEECFEDLTPHIRALETGLSSDPPMNWRVSALDRFQLISNSDAHSPAKLGREANLLDCELSYDGLWRAIQEGEGLAGTIEFFPEEGKYHYDGHRKCHLCLSPSEAENYNGICPVCGGKLTTGVSHRVEQLSDRQEGYVPQRKLPFESLVPLPEVIAASTGKTVASKKVMEQYERMLLTVGDEFAILMKAPIEEIRHRAGNLVAEGISRLRQGKVKRIPGYDGEYGAVKLLENWEIEELSGQMSLFGAGQMELFAEEEKEREESRKRRALDQSARAREREAGTNIDFGEPQNKMDSSAGSHPAKLNAMQSEAVKAARPAVAVIAGPGTGKTKTLSARVLHLIKNRKVSLSNITAVTFTNKAAQELKSRLHLELGKKQRISRMKIGTFHAICLKLLKDAGIEFMLADELETIEFAKDIVKEYKLSITPAKFLREVSLWKNQMTGWSESKEAQEMRTAAAAYQSILKNQRILDYDDLLLEALNILESAKGKELCKSRFDYLLVDEFQDINPLQYRLIKAFASFGKELFVIGDPDQSIYGFRGADAACFDRLRLDYPGLKTMRLDQNYRSFPNIIYGASAVISHNKGEKRRVRPCCAGDTKVRVVTAQSERSEAIFAAKEINRMIGGIDMLDVQKKLQVDAKSRQKSFSEIAVLYRTHRQAALIEECLKTEGIPFVTAGRDDFLLDPYVRATVCFFRYLMDSDDVAARHTCLRLLFDLPGNEISYSVFETLVIKYTKMMRHKPAKLLASWAEDMSIKDSKAVQKLLHVSVCYPRLTELMDCLNFGSEGDLRRCGGRTYQADAVTLTTLHGSKGLEFPSVILCGARKSVLPLNYEGREADIEEERRLFYVGMTRAKEELVITTSGEPSEFLDEIPGEYTWKEDALEWRQRDQLEQLSLFD